MRMLRKLMVIGGVAIATAAFPAMAQEGQQPAPSTEDHAGHHGGTDQQGAQQAPGGGMMGQGGMMGCPMMGDMMDGGKGLKKGMGDGMMMHSVPMMEARLAYIKADLEITEAQTPAWEAYADAVRAQHATMESMHGDMMKAKESGGVLERMDARIKAMESKVESLKALKPVTEALYALLSDEQKKKADQLLGRRCGMM